MTKSSSFVSESPFLVFLSISLSFTGSVSSCSAKHCVPTGMSSVSQRSPTPGPSSSPCWATVLRKNLFGTARVKVKHHQSITGCWLYPVSAFFQRVSPWPVHQRPRPNVPSLPAPCSQHSVFLSGLSPGSPTPFAHISKWTLLVLGHATCVVGTLPETLPSFSRTLGNSLSAGIHFSLRVILSYKAPCWGVAEGSGKTGRNTGITKQE